jgi:hypothetical protein
MNDPQVRNGTKATTLALLRNSIMAIFLLGALGTTAELFLIGHTEDRWQKVPLVLILASLIVLIFHSAFRRAASLRIFQIMMVLYILSGGVGLWLHYRGRMEFKLETNPELGGLELFWAVLKGAAVPPLLAPGTMILIGLLGLAYTYRHPHLISSKTGE